jgi:hypothetical protein
MPMRNDECRMRNVGGKHLPGPEARSSRAHSAFRILHSAFVFLAACSPVTTRPSFLPYPQALVTVLDAPAARVVPEAVGWLTSQGLQAQWSSPQDGYVETAWFNLRTHTSVFGDGDPGDLLSTVKLRCWADPNIPGKTQLTVEAVYRPMLDPSRPERDLEEIVPQGSEGFRIAQQLIDALKQKFGT